MNRRAFFALLPALPFAFKAIALAKPKPKWEIGPVHIYYGQEMLDELKRQLALGRIMAGMS